MSATTQTPQPYAPAPRSERRRTLRVLLADRSGSTRRALAAVIEDIDGVALVRQVESGEEVADALRRLSVDVLVVDDRLLPRNGDSLAETGPLPGSLRVVVLGMDDHPAFAAHAHRLGAEAWLAKHAAGDGLRALLTR
jgi:DNA-binding NarL/FixJ family response regulator